MLRSGPRFLVAGATGTIGRAVAARLAADGHSVTALVRPGGVLAGIEVAEAALDDPGALAAAMARAAPDIVISCIASRSGAPKDAEAVDFRANCALLEAAECAGAARFVLLSAICVQKPLLAFQHAKLAFEARLMASGLPATIIRPTAFFKSLSGQIERVRSGKPFLLFGDGTLTRCKPISDNDLANFIIAASLDEGAAAQILPIGGPGPAISPLEQGAILFALLGQEPRYRSVPVGMFTAAERVLGLGAGVFDWFAAKAEYARIARYYATESMLVLDAASGEYRDDLTPEFGNETLRDHYAKVLGAGA